MCVNYKKDCKYINGYYTQNHPENCEDSDHVALVVGWDDDFPADCFATPASRNGAWLVRVSKEILEDYFVNIGVGGVLHFALTVKPSCRLVLSGLA